MCIKRIETRKFLKINLYVFSCSKHGGGNVRIFHGKKFLKIFNDFKFSNCLLHIRNYKQKQNKKFCVIYTLKCSIYVDTTECEC